jgi:hypothetical protein
MKAKYHRRWRAIKVHCSTCDEWVDEKEVEFLNIEEDIEGKDLLTFVCHICKTKNKSHRVA